MTPWGCYNCITAVVKCFEYNILNKKKVTESFISTSALKTADLFRNETRGCLYEGVIESLTQIH